MINGQRLIENLRRYHHETISIDGLEALISQMESAQPSATDTNVGGNLIDRQAAISEIMEDLEDRSLHDDPATPEDYAEGYDEGIRNAAATVLQMPPAQPGWIPVTERLPKKDGDYLVTTHSGQIARYIFIGGSSEEYWRRCATAWMPLPTPYREGGQE